MQFGQILKNILDKNQEVWIPTIGLLGFDKATSKLNLDTYGSASDADLLQLIADIKQVSLGEAKGVLIQEVEGVKSAIRTNGKFEIENTGDISLEAGSFVFESKKTLFPTNFFGTGNFNPASFSSNTPKVEEEIKIITPPIEVKSQLDNFIVAEEKSETKEIVKEEKTGLFGKLKNLTKSKKVEKVETEINFNEPIVEPETTFIPEIKEEYIAPKVEEVITQEIIAEEKFEVENLVEDKIEETKEFIYESVEEPIVETEKKIEQIVITEPRRNIGNSRYDDGFYEFSGTLEEKASKKKWTLIGLLSLAIIAVGLIGAWVASNYFNKKKDVPVVAPEVKKIDTIAKIDTTAKIDTIKKVSKADSIAIAASVAKPVISTPTHSKATSTAPTSKPSTQPAQNTSTNTQPKTPSSSPASKKEAAVAAKSTTKTTEAKGTKTADVAPKVAKVKDTATKVKTPKAPVYNVIGKPYATANYTRGNYYLSFGKFKIPAAAAKLKKDMKARAGVETDIILLDGSYQVVIPYVNKDKAKSAAQDYPSTTLFE
jgi:hypothetical protein